MVLSARGDNGADGVFWMFSCAGEEGVGREKFCIREFVVGFAACIACDAWWWWLLFVLLETDGSGLQTYEFVCCCGFCICS